MVNPQPDFPLLVRKLRGQLGLTQEKFAAKLGVTFPTINRWENGRTKPSPLAIQHIKDFLKTIGKNGTNLRRKFFPDEQ